MHTCVYVCVGVHECAHACGVGGWGGEFDSKAKHYFKLPLFSKAKYYFKLPLFIKAKHYFKLPFFQ